MGQPVQESFVSRPLIFHYPHYRVSPPCSAIVIGDTKLLHFYEWPDQNFSYDLKTDLGEKSNIAAANAERSMAMYQQLMDRLKAVGGYLPKPNPNADPKAKRYDPNDLLDQGEGGDPEAGGDEKKSDGAGKKGKAKKKA